MWLTQVLTVLSTIIKQENVKKKTLITIRGLIVFMSQIFLIYLTSNHNLYVLDIRFCIVWFP